MFSSTVAVASIFIIVCCSLQVDAIAEEELVITSADKEYGSITTTLYLEPDDTRLYNTRTGTTIEDYMTKSREPKQPPAPSKATDRQPKSSDKSSGKTGVYGFFITKMVTEEPHIKPTDLENYITADELSEEDSTEYKRITLIPSSSDTPESFTEQTKATATSTDNNIDANISEGPINMDSTQSSLTTSGSDGMCDYDNHTYYQDKTCPGNVTCPPYDDATVNVPTTWSNMTLYASDSSMATTTDSWLGTTEKTTTSDPQPQNCSLKDDYVYLRHIVEDCTVGDPNMTLVLNKTGDGGQLLLALMTCCHKPCHVRVKLMVPTGTELQLNFSMLNIKGPYHVFSDGRRNCLREKLAVVRLLEGGEERMERQLCGARPYLPDNAIRLPVNDAKGFALDFILKENLLCGVDGSGDFQSLRLQYLVCDKEVNRGPVTKCQEFHQQFSAPGEDYEGGIVSPEFLSGGDYPNMFYCEWEIIAPKNQRILLWFTHFALEVSGLDVMDNCSNDHVAIITHTELLSDWQFPAVITLCGKSLPRTFVSPTDRLTIQFKSNENTVSSGFSLRYSFISQESFVPQLPSGRLDCENYGVPDYVMCDVKIDCEQREDESEDLCPVVEECQRRGGWAHYVEGKPSSCYWFEHEINNFTPPILSWLEAQSLCRTKYNARLVSLNTRAEVRLVEAFLKAKYPDLPLQKGIHLGLGRMTSQSPRVYKRLWQWQDNSVAWDPLDLFRIAEAGACSMWLIGGTLDVHLEIGCSGKLPAYVLCEANIDRETKMLNRIDFGFAIDDTATWPQATWDERKATYRCSSGERVDQTLHCDGVKDCRDGTDEVFCPENIEDSSFFFCKLGGRRLPFSSVCDGITQCLDSSDETFCIEATQATVMSSSTLSSSSLSSAFVYPDNTSACNSGYRIRSQFWCDGREHCPDSSDEQGCEGCADGAIWCPTVGCIPDNWTRVPDLEYDCEVKDETFSRYVEEDFLEGQTKSIPPPAVVELDGYGKSIIRRLAPHELCPETHLACPHQGYCIPVHLACNGIHDCVEGEDEAFDLCDTACVNMFKCRDSSRCLHTSQVCDFFPDCPHFDDETLCPEDLHCPAQCTCTRHEFVCANIPDVDANYYRMRYLDLSNSSRTMTGLDLSPLHSYNLVFLNLSTCSLGQLQPARLEMANLLILDLSFNGLHHLHSKAFMLTNQLRRLYLQSNELSYLAGTGSNCVNDLDPNLSRGAENSSFLCPLKRLEFLDLSNNPLRELQPDVFSSLALLQKLYLDNTHLTSLESGVFRGLSSLKILSLRGNILTSFSADVLAPTKLLDTLLTETHQLCCSGVAPKFLLTGSCAAPVEPVSNCQHLLGRTFTRVFVWCAGAISVLCNAFVLISRIMTHHRRRKTIKKEQIFQPGHSLLITAQAGAHLAFGLYLLVIASVDAQFSDNYLWHSDNWKSSGLCRLAGFLCTTSLRMSLILNLVLTVERLGVAMFPLYVWAHMTYVTAAKVTVVALTLSLSLGLLDLLMFSNFVGKVDVTSVCIPLVLRSEGAFFGSFLMVNCFLTLMVTTGLSLTLRQLCLDRERKEPLVDVDDVITTRATSILLSYDILLWNFAILILILSSMGLPITIQLDEVFITVLLPLSSAIFPFAYYRFNKIKTDGDLAVRKASTANVSNTSNEVAVYAQRPVDRMNVWLKNEILTADDITGLLDSMAVAGVE